MTTTTTRRRISKAEREEEERKFRVDVEIATSNPEFLRCHDVNHAWIVLSPRSFVRNGELLRKEQCVTCGLTKDRNLSIGGRCGNYKYPPGYRLPGVTKYDIRDYLSRQAGPPYESEEELLEALAAAEADVAAKVATPKRRARRRASS